MGSHKGYGLGAAVEVLCGLLSGGGPATKLGRPNFNHCVAAYNIETFTDTAEFKRNMDEWLKVLMSTKPAPGYDRVLYPGLPEAESEIEHRSNGIPLHREVVGWFNSICSELSIACPL